MEFNVAQLMKGSVGAVREYHFVESLSRIEDFDWAGPGEGQVRLTRTNRGVLVQAHLEAAIRVTCSRCLVEYQLPLHVEFKEEFLPTVDVGTGLPVAIDEEDSSAFTIDERHILDLHEAVRQYALLALPMQPVCEPNCRGLCPVCGANLNQGPCRCPRQLADHRWAALAGLEAGDDKEGVR